MWRERFGLDIAPSEKMKQLLLDYNNWERDDFDHEWAYHKIHSEYQIKFSGTNNNDQLYRFFYINHTSGIGRATFKYHSTELFDLNYALVDETRITIPSPSTASITVKQRSPLKYYYYDLSTRNGAFLTFLKHGKYDFNTTAANSTFIVFENSRIKNSFDEYLKRNYQELDNLEEPESAKYIESNIQGENGGFNLNLSEMMIIKLLFEQFKLIN